MDTLATQLPQSLFYDGMVNLVPKKANRTSTTQLQPLGYCLASISQPPSFDLYKINCDGATFDSENVSGIGAVICDSLGYPIATISQKLPREFQAAEIETMAATRALEFALEIGITDAMMEGDSLLVTQALATHTNSLALLGYLISNAKFLTNNFGIITEYLLVVCL
ncbi:hypothetical protein SO802_015609 [Lithocarpus litseifolius]|uniref:RNase H type-1 domain-containing protein n=1 Tax=Lithocarpus litseifolius TaxID=425828 RepID=A0AAW2CW91_9ROSI